MHYLNLKDMSQDPMDYLTSCDVSSVWLTPESYELFINHPLIANEYSFYIKLQDYLEPLYHAQGLRYSLTIRDIQIHTGYLCPSDWACLKNGNSEDLQIEA